jgi:hypothetical protein
MTQNRHNQTLSVLQATQNSPAFARLADLAMESTARLKSLESLIPIALRPTVRAGPIEGTAWCLLVNNNATAAKLRQLLPLLQAHLRSEGCEVTAIRIKIQTSPVSRTGPT